jgi:hypothetical protein
VIIFEYTKQILTKAKITVSDHYRHQWLMPIILTNGETEIRKTVVCSHPGKTVCEALFWKKKHNIGLVEWLKWKSTCLASVSPSSSPCSEKKVLTTYEIHHK